MKSYLRFFLPLMPLLAGGPILAQNSAAPEAPPEVSWQTDYTRALETAGREHKLVLLDFTGSDWCIWCHRLEDEILTQKPFLNFARANLVLVELDFPRAKAQSKELKTQNETLSGKFSVEGYPTIILVDPSGRELGRTGYMEGGAKTFVRELKRFSAKATPTANATP
jgi:thioredoxin-related protein